MAKKRNKKINTNIKKSQKIKQISKLSKKVEKTKKTIQEVEGINRIISDTLYAQDSIVVDLQNFSLFNVTPTKNLR